MLILVSLFAMQAALTQSVDRDLIVRTSNVMMTEYFPGGVREIVNIRSISEGVTTHIYVVDLNPEGWLLISASQKTKPVIGFSFEGRYEIPEPDRFDPKYSWLKTYTTQIKEAIQDEEVPVHPGWNDIIYPSYSKKSKKSGITVGNLIEVKWNQGSGYNRFCPADEDGPGGHAYAGCVAVAMSQAMSYYKYPTKGTGSHVYTSKEYGSLYVNYENATYLWDSMGSKISDDYNALLLYHTAVSVNMDFAVDGSGAFTRNTPSAMGKYFLYSGNMKMVQRYADDDEWKALLINELASSRPIIYAGDGNDGEAGHAFNIDGVINSNFFHLNWGWSGIDNGFYSLDDLTPGTHNFNFSQDAVIGIQPLYYPTDIVLNDSIVPVNMPAGTIVGIMSVVDEALDNAYTISFECDSTLVESVWVHDYFLEGDTLLKTGRVFGSYETGNDTVKISLTDQFGHECNKSLVLKISDGSSHATSSASLYKGMGDIRIYPNPVKSKLFIQVPGENNSLSGHLKIYSVIGSLVFHQDYSNIREGVDISKLPRGVYILELHMDAIASHQIKFIKE